ncbi:MAG TPA: sulfatase-like hydrolase/transferase [Ferruginibacter sp.]|nr:sulfatase-like hydrolase/transferase [Ferruginibacter sp.]
MLVLTVSRFIIYWKFYPTGKAFPTHAFITGSRFDARVAGVIALVILLLCIIPYLNPFKNPAAKKLWNIFLPIVFMILTMVLIVDFYHFDYLHQRLNATVLNYVEDTGISLNMIWQSYPLVWVLIGLVIIFLVARMVFSRLLFRLQQRVELKKRRSWMFYVVAILVIGVFIFGKIGQFPLRWSDAYALNDDLKANLALNPFQSFLSTLSFRSTSADVSKVRANYRLMSGYLGVTAPDSIALNFQRSSIATDTTGNRPNIVLVICESFSAYKSSMYNNPLNTTPFFNDLCKNGIFFDRCFTPAYGTARGVWATITGIPDVASPKTASRNPNAVDQNTIINSFTGYDNLYFLGGDATWANIRGVLTNNIRNLKLYEESDYAAKKIDVWGISDKDLFLEANQVLKKQNHPFFAIIQTADNHRPYTIPSEDLAELKTVRYSTDSLKRFGFESNEELNAFRYTDFTFRKFMEAAEKEAYFKNTIFVFVGDHGIRYNGKLEYLPASWTEQGLTCEHVPLLFYAPGRLKPQRITSVCSQVDILPSIASLARISYTNNSMGNNLFDTSTGAGEKYAFIIDHDVHTIGLVSNKYYFIQNLKTGKEDLVSMTNNDPVPVTAETGSLKNYLQKLTVAYYETAKYLLLNNKKKN